MTVWLLLIGTLAVGWALLTLFPSNARQVKAIQRTGGGQRRNWPSLVAIGILLAVAAALAVWVGWKGGA